MHVDVALTNTDLQPHADSADFAGPAGRRVQSGISIFPSPSLPTRWIQLYSTGPARACLATNLGASTQGTVRASSLSLPSIGDGAVGIRFTAGSTTLDALFARRGRALAYLAVQTPDGVDEAVLLSKVIGRLTPAAQR